MGMLPGFGRTLGRPAMPLCRTFRRSSGASAVRTPLASVGPSRCSFGDDAMDGFDDGGVSNKILIIYTGGTLGMRPHPTTGLLSPDPEFLSEELYRFHSEVNQKHIPDFDVVSFKDPVDSSEMDPSHWKDIASRIYDNYYDYRGFLVLHGTDTMAYTASAVSFMLRNLGKPVVFTGGQRPFSDVLNDSRRNLIASMVLAGNDEISEVVVCFSKLVLRGNRVTKSDSWNFTAFESPNIGPLGVFGSGFKVDMSLLLPHPKQRVQLYQDLDPNVCVVHLFPGLRPVVLENMLKDPVKGVVIKAYGLGNVPLGVVDVLERFTKRGGLSVMVSACLKGGVDSPYETGQRLLSAGAISGHDMTVECAVTKMMYVLGRGRDISLSAKQAMMEKCIRGELTNTQATRSIEGEL